MSGQQVILLGKLSFGKDPGFLHPPMCLVTGRIDNQLVDDFGTTVLVLMFWFFLYP